MKRNVVSLVLALAVAAGLTGFHFLEDRIHIDFLSNVEAKLVDLRFRLRGPRKPSGEVVIVAIDSKSVDALGRWPWSRNEQARLVNKMRGWGASAVVFDVLFLEPEGLREAEQIDRLVETLAEASPEAAKSARPVFDAARREVLADGVFADSLEQTVKAGAALPVMAFDFVFPEDSKGRKAVGRVLSGEDEMIVLDLASYPSRDQNVAALRQHPPKLALGIRPVVTELASWCAGLGFVNYVGDVDGSLRRERIVIAYSPAVRQAVESGKPLSAALLDPAARVQAFMPLAVSAVATHLRLPIDSLVLDIEHGELRFPVRAGSGGDEMHSIKFDPDDGTMCIDFYGPANTFETYSFVDVLRDELKSADGRPVSGKDVFGRKLVFVGMSDPGLGDYFTTPYTAQLPGVEKHATVAENLLRGRSLRTPRDPDLVVILSALAAGVVVALVVGNVSPILAGIALALVAFGWFMYSYNDFVRTGLVWNWAIPGFTMLLGYAAVTTYRQLIEERAKREIRSTFSTYMSPAAVDEILKDPDKLTLGGSRRVCTIFFSDLVGFTSLSESMSDPTGLVTLLNRYLGRMTELILDEDGILDKYIGDAIMAIFGAPIVRADHAARACHAALRNLEALKKLQAEFKAEGLPVIDFRIGINTGDVLIGNLGSKIRMDYTVIGDAVNLASRLEGANKVYGTRIMVGEWTKREAEQHDPELVFRDLDLISVKGKTRPAQVFELVGKRVDLSESRRLVLEKYEEAIALYRRRDFTQALAKFEEIWNRDPNDGPTWVYVGRCQAFLNMPPPDDWDGVFHMQTK